MLVAYQDVARSVVVFLTMQGPHHGSKLYKHLKAMGDLFPDWLFEIIPNKDYTPPMASFAEAISKLWGGTK